MAKWPTRGAVAAPAPAELLEFNPDDWPLGPPDTTPWERWHRARLAWLKANRPRKLNGMDLVDCIFEEIPN